MTAATHEKSRAGRPGATLRLIVDNRAGNNNRAQFPPAPPAPLGDWQRRFLRGLAAWPFPLHPAQRELLRWIAES